MALNPFGTLAPKDRRVPAVPLKNGKIAAVKASLILPYYDMGLAIEKEIQNSQTVADADGFRLVGSFRPTALTRHTRRISNITKHVSDRVCKGVRPGAPCSPPRWAKQLSGLSWVYPMGTFDGLNLNNLPAVLRKFAIPVVQEGDDDVLTVSENIETVPPWKCSKLDPETGRPRTQWFITIPFALQNGERPTIPWSTGLGNDCYQIPESTFRTLNARCLLRIEKFFTECQDDPRLLRQFYSDLSAAEKVSNDL